MTIGLDRLLAHMAWANKLTIEHLQTLPEDSLKAYATNADWHAGEIIHHIVEAADFYVYRIRGEFAEVPGEKLKEIEKISDLELLKSQAVAIDAALAECMKLDDIQVEFENSRKERVKRWRSTILSQAIHHATEHRAQLASALEAKGFKAMDLDEMDLWRFEINHG